MCPPADPHARPSTASVNTSVRRLFVSSGVVWTCAQSGIFAFLGFCWCVNLSVAPRTGQHLVGAARFSLPAVTCRQQAARSVATGLTQSKVGKCGLRPTHSVRDAQATCPRAVSPPASLKVVSATLPTQCRPNKASHKCRQWPHTTHET